MMTMVQCNGYENSNSNGIGNDYYKNLDNIAQGNFLLTQFPKENSSLSIAVCSWWAKTKYTHSWFET